MTEPQNDECLSPTSVQEIQDIDSLVTVNPDDRQFLIEQLIRKRVRVKILETIFSFT